MDDMARFLNSGGMVGILDATNSTRDRRAIIHEKCLQYNLEVFYVESVCDNETRIEETIMVGSSRQRRGCKRLTACTVFFSASHALSPLLPPSQFPPSSSSFSSLFVLQKVKVNLPEYQLLTPEDARNDFLARIKFYQSKYESLSPTTDSALSFLQIVDLGRYFIVNKPTSFLQMRIVR